MSEQLYRKATDDEAERWGLAMVPVSIDYEAGRQAMIEFVHRRMENPHESLGGWASVIVDAALGGEE